MSGFFIALEGIDGTGKSTQAKLLAANLSKLNREVLLTFEPGDNPKGSKIRELLMSGLDDPVAEALVFAADRSLHVKTVVKPAMDSGKVVICDRFLLSSIAYQSYGKGLDLEWVKLINEKSVEGILPDITILLDAPPSVGLKRAKCDNHFENEALLEKVRNGFLLEAKKKPDKIIVVDSNSSVDAIEQEILSIVTRTMEV